MIKAFFIKFERLLTHIWYENSLIFLFFLPISWIYGFTVKLRRILYQFNFLSSYKASVPVIVVGNISIGGTGKTPLVIEIANKLAESGFSPGIICHGFGSKIGNLPIEVSKTNAPAEVGDESIVIARKVNCPIVVHPNRALAARTLEKKSVDVIIVDDGLQHYGLKRDIEIIVIDGDRGLGNKKLLPAGPLRESQQRLKEVDYIFVQSKNFSETIIEFEQTNNIINFYLDGSLAYKINNHESKNLHDFKGQHVHAIAGIGNPERFFNFLAGFGIKVTPHFFYDHVPLESVDLEFNDNLNILMTEKDAVKCRFFTEKNIWYIPVHLKFQNSTNLNWLKQIEDILKEKLA